MAASIAVHPHEEVELGLAPLDGGVEVAAFEVRVEAQEGIVGFGVEGESAAGGEKLVEVLVGRVGIGIGVSLVYEEGVALAGA